MHWDATAQADPCTTGRLKNTLVMGKSPSLVPNRLIKPTPRGGFRIPAGLALLGLFPTHIHTSSEEKLIQDPLSQELGLFSCIFQMLPRGF